jgi:hypothetical protein
MSKPGGAVSQGPHVGAANRMCARQEAFTHFNERYAGYNYFTVGKNRVRSTSKYMPHQGERECARRVIQEKRRHDKYMMNGGFTRSGNEVGSLFVAGRELI